MESEDITKKLLENNRNWARGIDPIFFKNSAEKKQHPQVLWIGCSDSRVPESVITNSLPGEIFVHRNIANQVHLGDDNTLSVVQYAVLELKVKHVIVVGHTECGGAKHCVEEVLGQPPVEPSIGPLHRWLVPLVKLARDNNFPNNPITVPILVKKNVKQQVETLRGIPAIADAKVQVHGWVYDLSTGLLDDKLDN